MHLCHFPQKLIFQNMGKKFGCWHVDESIIFRQSSMALLNVEGCFQMNPEAGSRIPWDEDMLPASSF